MKYTGVSFEPRSNKYRAYIYINKKVIHLGNYDTDRAAAVAYDKAALFYNKENLNFPELIDIYKEDPYNPRQARPRSGKYLGVCYHQKKKRWVAYITVNGKRINIGKFKDETSAAIAYDKAAIKYRGNNAKLNFPS